MTIEKSDLVKFIGNSNNLGFKVLVEGVRRQQSRNILISPAILYLGLLAMLNGARGKTAESIQRVLNTEGWSDETLQQLAGVFTRNLGMQSENLKLHLASSLWLKEGVTLNSSVQETLQQHFMTEMESLAKGVPAINQWVREKTNGCIPSIVNKLNSEIQFMMLSAIYFRANWQFEFDPASTYPRKFKTVYPGPWRLLTAKSLPWWLCWVS